MRPGPHYESQTPKRVSRRRATAGSAGAGSPEAGSSAATSAGKTSESLTDLLGDWTMQLAAGILIGVGLALFGVVVYNLITG